MSSGHYPDTLFMSLDPSKIGETPRTLEVYLKDIELIV